MEMKSLNIIENIIMIKLRILDIVIGYLIIIIKNTFLF